jgi:hypothetical protein
MIGADVEGEDILDYGDGKIMLADVEDTEDSGVEAEDYGT